MTDRVKQIQSASGRRIGILKQIREESDYDDFYIALEEKAMEQIQTAELILQSVIDYLEK